MMIYFRSIKYQTTENVAVVVREFQDGVNILVGDTVTILLEISQEIAEAISENLSAKSGVTISDGGGCGWIVNIPFNVVERRHEMSWHSPHAITNVMTSVYLEAQNGYWEDVFKWAILGKKPTWADGENQEETSE